MIFQTWWFPTKAEFYARMLKSKMAAKIHDDGQKFLVFSTRIFSLAII